MALTNDSLFWKLGIAFGVILLGGLGYSVMSGNKVDINSGLTNNVGPYINVKEQTRYNTEVNKNVGGSRKRKDKDKKIKRKSRNH
jgi:hypothetical protein